VHKKKLFDLGFFFRTSFIYTNAVSFFLEAKTLRGSQKKGKPFDCLPFCSRRPRPPPPTTGTEINKNGKQADGKDHKKTPKPTFVDFQR